MISRQQLRSLGFGEEAISQAVASARLYPLADRRFRSVGQRQPLHGRLMAATLACGDGTVVSHGSAAWLLGLWKAKPGEVEVIAQLEAGRKISEIRRRFPPPPPPSQVRKWQGIPCTSPARTLVDLSGISGVKALVEAVEEAAVLGVLDVPAIDGILDESRRRGSRRLNLILEEWRRYTPKMRLRSRMEARMLPLLTHYALPIPETNEKLRIAGRVIEVDFLWREQRVIVETDGGRFHDHPRARGGMQSGISCWLALATGCPASDGSSSGMNRTKPWPKSPSFSVPPSHLFLSRPWQRKGTDDRALRHLSAVRPAAAAGRQDPRAVAEADSA